MSARVVAIVLIAAAVIGAPSASFGQPEPRAYVGRAVVDVLKELQATRLKIIFSSELVPPSLRVAKEPRGTDAREIALQLLEPHGLTLREGPGGIFVVVRRRQRPDARKPAAAKSAPAQPAPTTDATDPLRIEEHVEVSDRSSRTGGSRAYSVEPEAVREMAGGLDNVLQSLAALPGVAAVNDEEGKLAVRGAGPEHNMIVLDGVQIHNARRLGEFTTSFLNPATAANITLDPSGLDARFGGRLSSVVNLETRDGTTDRTLATSGSIGLTSGDVLLEGRMPGTTSGSWWATLRGTYYRLVADRFREGAMPSFADLQVKTTLYPSKNTRLTMFALAGREMLLELDREPGTPSVVRASNKEANRIAAGTLRWMPSSRFSSATTLSAYSNPSRYLDSPFLGFADIGNFDRHALVHDVAVRHQMLFAWSKGRMIDAGVNLHRVNSSWKMVGVKPQEWWRGVGPSTWGELVDYSAGPIDSRLERTQTGGWLQFRFEAGRFATIEPGLRFDWNSYTGETAWQPRLRVSRAFGRTSVWAGLSLQAQTPSHESLQGFEYFDFPRDGSDLRNERTRQIVAGFERPLGSGFDLRVEGYGRSFDRLLVQRQETEAERQNRLRVYVIPPDLPPDSPLLEHRPTVFPVSTGSGRATGLEVFVRRERRRVTGSVGYTLATSTRDLYGYTMPSDFDRRHAANGMIEVPVTRRVRTAATWQISSGFPTTPVREEVFFGRPFDLTTRTYAPLYRSSRYPDGRLLAFISPFQRRLSSINSERLSGYERTDIRGTYSTLGHWEFYAEVLNVFNHKNHVQTVSETRDTGEKVPISRSNVYNTFERLFSFGMRVKF